MHACHPSAQRACTGAEAPTAHGGTVKALYLRRDRDIPGQSISSLDGIIQWRRNALNLLSLERFSAIG
jgi:hypothetical protein